MINETTVKQLKPSTHESPQRAVSPPLLASPNNRHVMTCKATDELYRCSSVDSVDSLRHTFTPSGVSSAATRKYIAEDRSRYESRARARRAARRAPHTCCTNFLRPRMQFSGYQISDYKKYQVTVSLQTVALPDAPGSSAMAPHVTGFLSIRGLTSQHPEITTFFDGYAVTDNLGFLSSALPPELDAFKATDKTDLEHWLSFPCFKELCRPESACDEGTNVLGAVLEGSYSHEDYLQNRFIYMRWKEKFLVPDAEIDSVEGASYDGYYYIVHDQVTGHILGFYYHQDAEKFQQLELTPLQDPCAGDCSFEFN